METGMGLIVSEGCLAGVGERMWLGVLILDICGGQTLLMGLEKERLRGFHSCLVQ